MRHGGDLSEAAHLFGQAPDWIDLSTGINPHPWPIPPALATAGWTALPTRADGEALLAAARAAYAVPHSLAIVAGPGSQALLQWLPRLAPPGPVQVFGPTYRGHAEAWRAAGAETITTGRDGLRDDVRHAVIVNPNNPDGHLWPTDEILSLASRCAERGGWLMVDEAFADVDSATGIAPHLADEPVVVVRSFGKFYGLPGLRLGFAIAPERIAALLRDALGDWPVSVPALLVGRAGLSDRAWAEAMRTRLKAEARALDEALRPLPPAGGTSLFRLRRHPAALHLHRALAQAGLWTRRFDWDDHLLRIGLPPYEEALSRLARIVRETVR